MERNKEYKLVQSKINDLNSELDWLHEHSIVKMQAEAHKDIETHFDHLIFALKSRKDTLLRYVDQECLIIKQSEDLEEQELRSKIEKCTDILVSGASFYESNQSVALYVWQGVDEITFDKPEKEFVKVDLPIELLEGIIIKHGIVTRNDVNISTSDEHTTGEYRATRVTTLTKVNESSQGKVEKLRFPYGVAHNPLDDCLYVCDTMNNSIRKITLAGEVTTFVHLTSSAFGITYNDKENCFLVSDHHSIKRVSMEGYVSTLAGSNKSGHQDNEGVDASFTCPVGITVNEENGDVYVADSENHVIRKITKGVTSTVAGTPEKRGYVDGDCNSSLFDEPRGIAFHLKLQAIIICDFINGKLRQISLEGHVSTICDIPSPMCPVVLPNGDILVSSRSNQIFKVSLKVKEGTSISKVEAFAGSGEKGERDGMPLESQFSSPQGLTIDLKTNTCFVADYFNNKIRAIHFE